MILYLWVLKGGFSRVVEGLGFCELLVIFFFGLTRGHFRDFCLFFAWLLTPLETKEPTLQTLDSMLFESYGHGSKPRYPSSYYVEEFKSLVKHIAYLLLASLLDPESLFWVSLPLNH